jgi:putative tricarboxylic transport membrane protein
MQTFDYLMHGFAIALTGKNLFYCLIGCLWGTVVGVLPGVGPLAGMALLLPLTYKLDPTGAIIMLSGIFYGAMYGGSTTSILVRMPGEAASVITCIDGYEMARKGRAGPALFLAGMGSFVGGTLSVIGLMLFAPVLATVMLKVGPAAEFILMIFALLVVSFVAIGSRLKVLAMIVLGLLLATVGIDSLTGWSRFTFGQLELSDGLNFVALSIGLFGVSEILLSFEETTKVKPIKPTLRQLLPNREELRASRAPIARGSLIGFVFGIFPGVSHIVSTFVSYAVEKRLSKNPEEFGRGAVAGVAGPETANNATTGSSLIPLLVLGIPAIPSTAILLSAFLIHGVQPGPQLINDHPDVFWGLIASMYIGNLILVALNVPLVGIFVNLLRISFGYLAPIILLISIIGVYSVNSNILDVWIMLGAGIVGYLLRKFDYDVAPLLLALVLGDRIETNFRRALTISDGDYSIFAQGPAARVFISALALIVILQGIAIAAGYNQRAASEKDAGG